MKVVCPYCRNQAKYIDSEEIYGVSFGMMYICVPCDARVGVHKVSKKPLGTLANVELRNLRKEVHILFDQLWKSGKKSRSEAYSGLAKRMDIPIEECHIAMFDSARCLHAITIIETYMERK